MQFKHGRPRSVALMALCFTGKPPAWTPLKEPTKLNEDKGEYFRDQNAARFPSYPMQPTVDAILKQNSEFDTKEIDIVACGSAFGNLLRFILRVDREYRMLVEVVGSTVFFVRRENSPTQTIQNIHGFGHAFPEAYTTWPADVKESESHQRLIRYSFAGMECVMRFQGDGYLPGVLTPTESKSQHTKSEKAGEGMKVNTEQELTSALNNANLGTRDVDATGRKALKVHTGGSHIPHASIFDLKTRTIRKKDRNILGEELPRLWVAQVPNFILAFHKGGMFNLDDVQIRNVQEEVANWEAENKDSQRRLAVLVKLLAAFARSRPDSRFELIHEEGKKALELREVTDYVNWVLPHALGSLWAKGKLDNHSGGGISSLGQDYSDVPEYLESDSESERDYTACNPANCGYCGHCRY